MFPKQLNFYFSLSQVMDQSITVVLQPTVSHWGISGTYFNIVHSRGQAIVYPKAFDGLMIFTILPPPPPIPYLVYPDSLTHEGWQHLLNFKTSFWRGGVGKLFWWVMHVSKLFLLLLINFQRYTFPVESTFSDQQDQRLCVVIKNRTVPLLKVNLRKNNCISQEPHHFQQDSYLDSTLSSKIFINCHKS